MKPLEKWDSLICKTVEALPATSQDYKPEWDANRYFVGGTMFAMRGENKEGRPIFTVKLPPADGEMLRQKYPDILPGYYMNKQHWSSLLLDGAVPEEILVQSIKSAHRTVLLTLPKKKQAAIEMGNNT